MHFNLWVASALCAVALAVPTVPSPSTAAVRPEDMKIVSDYFKLVASKVKILKDNKAPTCDYNKAVMPAASPTPLPAVGAGFTLKHVAIGRGVQNYTCDLTNSTAIPVAIGAVAVLYDASCVAATFPDVLALTPPVTLQFDNPKSLTPSNLIVSGHHWFDSTGVPIFDLDTTVKKLGVAHCARNASAPAPADAIVGQGNVGFGSVPWLKLTTTSLSTGGLQEVYRINTAGGKPPPNCAGGPPTIEVPYSTEYWFYGT